ncbi:MAG: O-antigen ligase family protein [Parcubacteria group bacterium]
MFHVEHSTSNKTSTTLNCSTWNIFSLIIILVGFIQSAIGIIQVLIQRSIGLSVLGESMIAPNIPGVAKIVFHLPRLAVFGEAGGERYIRAYGLFPHPNILGGYLLLSIILTLLYLKLFHPPRLAETRRREAGVEQFEFLRGGTILVGYVRLLQVILYAVLALQVFALILSFSKSAILGLFVALLYIYVPRGTSEVVTGWNNSRLRIAILSILIIISLGLLANQDLDRNLEQSFQERLTYLNVSRGTILANPVLGVGIGQFVWNMQRYALVPLEVWQFQPVHNVFLLIWSELGIIGLGLFIYWLYKVFTAKPILSNDNTYLSIDISLRYFKGILLGFIFIMLFDHYFWDIQQGSLMLWIILGFIAGMKLYKDS